MCAHRRERELEQLACAHPVACERLDRGALRADDDAPPHVLPEGLELVTRARCVRPGALHVPGQRLEMCELHPEVRHDPRRVRRFVERAAAEAQRVADRGPAERREGDLVRASLLRVPEARIGVPHAPDMHQAGVDALPQSPRAAAYANSARATPNVSPSSAKTASAVFRSFSASTACSVPASSLGCTSSTSARSPRRRSPVRRARSTTLWRSVTRSSTTPRPRSACAWQALQLHAGRIVVREQRRRAPEQVRRSRVIRRHQGPEPGATQELGRRAGPRVAIALGSRVGRRTLEVRARRARLRADRYRAIARTPRASPRVPVDRWRRTRRPGRGRARTRAVVSGADESTPLQGAQASTEFRAHVLTGRESADVLSRERAAHDCGTLEQCSLARLEDIDPTREQRFESRRDAASPQTSASIAKDKSCSRKSGTPSDVLRIALVSVGSSASRSGNARRGPRRPRSTTRPG